MSVQLEAIPIDVFFDSKGTGPNMETGLDALQSLNVAEVVIGRDVMTGHEFILYGRDAVNRIATGEELEDVPIVFIALDYDKESDELERVIELIRTMKGRHDYESYCQGKE